MPRPATCDQTTRPSQSQPAPRKLIVPDRELPKFGVEIEGQKFEDLKYLWMVEAAEIKESYGRLSYARIQLYNESLRFTNDPLWKIGSKVKLFSGYPSTGLKPRLSTWVLHTPHFNFQDDQRITLECFSEEYLMGRTEKRRTWKSMTDSGIVSKIAQDYGFKADVDTTTPTHRQVIQANCSDIKFIQSRAKLHGFVVYVQNGTLHFHAPRYTDSGKVLAMKQAKSDFGSFRAWVEMGNRAKRVKKTQIDPLKKETFSVSSEEKPDAISKQGMQKAEGSVLRWDDISKTWGVEEVHYLIGEGHEQEEKAAETMVEVASLASRWIVRGRTKLVGLEDLSVGEVITIAGIGRWSGQYLIIEITHRMVGGYQMEIDLARTWTGDVSRSKTKGCGLGGPLYGIGKPGDVTSSLRRSMTLDTRSGRMVRYAR